MLTPPLPRTASSAASENADQKGRKSVFYVNFCFSAFFRLRHTLLPRIPPGMCSFTPLFSCFPALWITLWRMCITHGIHDTFFHYVNVIISCFFLRFRPFLFASHKQLQIVTHFRSIRTKTRFPSGETTIFQTPRISLFVIRTARSSRAAAKMAAEQSEY